MHKRKSKKPSEAEYELHEKPIYEFKPGIAGHEWRQQGPFLVCQSCELKHSLYIGINKHLKGFDKKGNPIIEKL